MDGEKDNRRILTVTQLNEYVKMLLDGDTLLAGVYVKGEISNFTNHYKTGHYYFTVKDEGGLIKAVMFRGNAAKLGFVPENGMKIIAFGRVSAYVRDGQYQIYVESMEQDGIGSLYIAFEQLKRKLSAEGLFDETRKPPIPKIPSRVGVITSPTGAAVRDIINVLGRRFPYAEIILYPVLVQGEGAPEQLIEAVRYFGRTRSADVLIIGRGGGSIEDLWGFNSEALAREIAACPVPTISAVGHETDFTICDFVCSKRAPTPSAAAEIAVPETGELMHKICNVTAKNELLLKNRIAAAREKLAYFATRPVLVSPERYLDDRRMEIAAAYEKLSVLSERMLTEKRTRLSVGASKMDALSPLSVLDRGYAMAQSGDGHVLSSVKQIKENEKFTLSLSDGSVEAEALKITGREKQNEQNR